jgi:CRP-like cAMP-binding protein
MTAPIGNLLLKSLSPGNRERLMGLCTPVGMPQRAVLCGAGEIPDSAYFITSGVASVVTSMPEGAVAEVAVIGREGMFGAMNLMGPALTPTDCFLQVAGTALRISMGDLRTIFEQSEEVRRRILEFAQQQMLMLAQVAGCNRLHSAEQRLARWLLMVQDRNDGPKLELTQEFLSQMVGSRRTTVTEVAGTMHKRGLVQTRRGQVEVLDRVGLEGVACDCYPIMKRLLDDLYKNNQPNNGKVSVRFSAPDHSA